MAKRPVEVGAGNEEYLKRQKITHVTPASIETIQSPRQLSQLLAFDQDPRRAKHGIQSFKFFLDGLADEKAKSDEQGHSKANMSLLKAYLVSQLPEDEDDKTSSYLADVMQTWSFAAQSNDESLLSAVPAVLALLLKTLSGALDLVEYGLRLGRTLLQKRQLELLARGMSSLKTKDFVISPALRLLREVTIFDGGVLAKQIFRSGDYTLKALARNLGLRFVGDGVETRRKPSVRTNAMRYLHALIKFLPVEAKKELMNQRDILSGLTRDISRDPSFLIEETLQTLTSYVVQDDQLPREAKVKIFNGASLGRLGTLYGHDQHHEEVAEGKAPIDSLVHNFLILLCTSPGLGILYRDSGYYPRGFDASAGNEVGSNAGFIDLGLDGLERADRFSDRVVVRNNALSEFIQTLRPWSSMKQAELLLAIFRAAPELVANYFFGKKSFSFDPKLTATWIGYSAFLFSTVRLPPPPYFGNRGAYGLVPPPTSIVIESILPQPLTQKSLARCLNQSSPLVTFFAVRILIVAFEKLEEILTGYRAASQMSSLWNQAATQLTEEFNRRCPTMKDVINTFRSTAVTSLMQRQAISKLLVLYYAILPQTALEAKFDVSPCLAQALRLLRDSEKDSEEAAMRGLEVENLFIIAHRSPGMRWFHKAESFPISPFTAMLQLLTTASSKIPLVKIRSILDSVIEESGIVQLQTKPPALDALIWAVQASSEQNEPGLIYDFLDDCALRCSSTPIRYMDALDIVSATATGSRSLSADRHPVSLLLLAIAEQWPFITKSDDSSRIEAVARFIAYYLAYSMKISEDKRVLRALIKDMAVLDPEKQYARSIIKGSRAIVDTLQLPSWNEAAPKLEEKLSARPAETSDLVDVEASMLEPIEGNFDDHKAALRWVTKQVDEIVEEGHAGALIMLLSSPHIHVRKEAMINIAKLAAKTKESTYEEKQQIWLLFCEVMETARASVNKQPLPTTISLFTARAISVLSDPLHCLYPKLNKFLSRGPAWEVDRIPLMNSILNEPPALDDGYYPEVDWLLDYLRNALRTSADMLIYHKRHVFERLLSLYSNPYLTRELREKILKILFQATTVEGGSTTLVTRFSIVSWLRAQMRLENGPIKLLKALMSRILETSDGSRLLDWSHRSIDGIEVDL
ncbi:MAG: hypothetical protein M1818_001242 [Claussenomyces sp. TS43310]|nr:MAG: hypothetical protein M1818_001242 [Claussenomyces sp. TS43310]